MRNIKFTKIVASGNDFIIIENREPCLSGRQARTDNRRLSFLTKKICDRKFGVGADGMLVLEKSRIADIRMRIFNADGSEAEMCGNGARCVALWATENREPRTENLTIETKAGIIRAQLKAGSVKIRLTNPKNIKLDLPIKVNNRTLKVNFIDTGVPHVVIFVQGLEKIDVFNLGRAIRYHQRFSPRGTNVDFVEVTAGDSINIRTYERGVEDETLACGTGSTAAALIFALKSASTGEVYVGTKSGEILKVYFQRSGNRFSEVWLEGRASIVFRGEIIL